MEIEDNTNHPPSKAPKTKSNPSIVNPASKSNGKHEQSWKSSLDKISSNDLADSINHIEEMIHDIQIFSSIVCKKFSLIYLRKENKCRNLSLLSNRM